MLPLIATIQLDESSKSSGDRGKRVLPQVTKRPNPPFPSTARSLTPLPGQKEKATGQIQAKSGVNFSCAIVVFQEK